MNTNELAQLTANLLTQYYDNNIEPFFNHCHEDVLWLGPAKGQMIRGKKNLVKAFNQENNSLSFKVHNLISTPFYISSNCTEVLLTFIVDTFWPNGGTNRVYQRITFTWEIKKDIPLIRVCHISNSIDYDARDAIYPIHYLENHTQMTLYSDSSTKLYFNGTKHSILYTSPEQILYLESNHNHTLIHLNNQVFECNERLSSINNRIKDKLIRCHSSYIVNPIHVTSIGRFYLIMSDDKRIPIPEKKYTKIKAALLKKS